MRDSTVRNSPTYTHQYRELEFSQKKRLTVRYKGRQSRMAYDLQRFHALIAEFLSGSCSPRSFRDRYVSLWIDELERDRALPRRPRHHKQIVDLIDELHSTTYHYTDNTDDLRDDPEFYTSVEELRKCAERVHARLGEFLESS
jgi:hypothetical protein